MFDLREIEKDELVANCDRLAILKYDKLDALHQKANEQKKELGIKKTITDLTIATKPIR